MTHLYAADQYHGLFSERWLFNGSAADKHYTAGGGTDSAYEYFLKQYLLTGDLKAKEQCERLDLRLVIIPYDLL